MQQVKGTICVAEKWKYSKYINTVFVCIKLYFISVHGFELDTVIVCTVM